MSRRSRAVPAPSSDSRTVGSGLAELLRDTERDGGWMLFVDGVPQSYVDLHDPTHLDFEYMRLLGGLVDELGEPDAPLDVLHVGGAGCTLARYVAATRPGSRQVVFDPDAELVAFVRERLPVRGVRGLRIRVTGGREGVAVLGDAVDDLVVLDAFAGAVVPPELVTAEFVAEVVRVLRPGGSYLLNIADGPGLIFARRVVATLRERFGHALLMADPSVLRNRRFGNLVLAASDTPLPVDRLGRVAAGGPFRARLVAGDDLVAFTAGARPLVDAVDFPLPVPPERVFGQF